MGLTVSEKIRVLIGRKNMTITELASKLNMTPQNLHNKLKRDNFSEKEISEIANVLDCKYEINFLFENGDKI